MGKNGNQIVQEVTQAALAIIVVAGAIAVTVLMIARGSSASDLPGWLELGVGAVLGFYYGSKSATSVVQTMSNGPMTTIAQLAQRSGPRSTDPVAPPTPGASTT